MMAVGFGAGCLVYIALRVMIFIASRPQSVTSDTSSGLPEWFWSLNAMFGLLSVGCNFVALAGFTMLCGYLVHAGRFSSQETNHAEQ